MQTSTRTVSRACSLTLPCISLWSMETGLACSSPQGAQSRGGRGQALGTPPSTGPGAAEGCEQVGPKQSPPVGGGEGAGGPYARGPRPPLTHMQAGGKLEDGSHWSCEPAGGQAQARPPQEGTLGSRLEG